jgi:EKC/KEOPS complex subunit CGI121/TPRKB
MAGAMAAEFAFLNAALVPDALVLRMAAHRALCAQSRGRLATRSLHAEVVFNVSGSKHIAETLRRFGIADDSRHLLAARFDASDADLSALAAAVSGSAAPLAELAAVCDGPAVAKAYKVTPEELRVGSVVQAIGCRIAARD